MCTRVPAGEALRVSVCVIGVLKKKKGKQAFDKVLLIEL